MNERAQPLGPALAELLADNKLGTMATVGEDGLPRLSVVYYADRDGRILVSTLRDRLKTTDVERTGWAALSVRGAEAPYPSATFAGRASVRFERIEEDTALIMGRMAGLPEPPEPQRAEALAEAGRVLIEIEVEKVTAVSYL